MNRKKLHQLYAEHTGKVSDKWSSYLAEYDRLFDGLRDEPVRFLEIGIQNGGSLEIWSKYFDKASTLIGCDINPDCGRLVFDDPRIDIVIGDANAVDTSAQVFKRCPQFDIVIDDGSHLSSDIVKSFALYFPRLAEGGLFIAEDLHCSYWEQFEGGLFDPYSSISFFKRLADVINHEHWGIEKRRDDVLRGVLARFGCGMEAESLSEVHAVEFINSMCVVRKQAASDNGLGRRVITGSLEAIVPGHLELHDLPYQLDPIFDQSENPWTAREVPPDEALLPTEQALAEARFRAAMLEQKSATMRDALADAQHKAAAIEQRNAALAQELARLHTVEQSLAEVRHEAAVSEQRNAALSEEVGRLRETAQALAGAQQQIAALAHEVASLRNSTSWRITAPMRLIVTGARAVAGRLTQSGGPRLVPAAASVVGLGRGTPGAAFEGSLRDALLRRGHVFYRRHMRGTRLGRLIGQEVLKRGLVNAAELQTAALSYSDPALPEVRDADAAQVEVDAGVPGFHHSPPLNLEVSDALAVHPSINMLLPSLQLRHMSGGPNTALLLAALLAERGEHVRLIACDVSVEGKEAALFPHMDALLQRPVARERIELVDAFDRSRPSMIGANDLFFATAWWTAQIAKYALAKTVCKTFIYLIQDFEPILHEGSTLQARALETYGLPHIPVINTRLLLDYLIRQDAGRYADPAFAADALWFEPALDRRHYFPDPGKIGQSGRKVLLFYARPTVARRNLFELGVMALRQAVASGAIDDNWEVWAMGEKLPPIPLGKGMVLNPLPWLSFDAYAQRVRTADLLLSLMLSPHPSYPPLEMAASGKLVVTNSFSVKSAERMRAFSPNIIVAEPTAESVSAAICNAARRINAGLPSHDPSGAIALPSDWDQSLRQVVPQLLARIHALRAAPPEPGLLLVAGYPAAPRSEYEIHRRACLARRRSEDGYRQVPGLLSFVTSAYNTDPVFLEELGRSVFLQDGGMRFEWLILDNGSTNDRTRRALQDLADHPGVRLERVEHNLGIIGGMRYCLERARGRYILPLDSDDLIEPDCVHVLTRFIVDNAYPPLLYTDEDKFAAGRFGSPYFKPDWDPVLFLHSCYIAHLCAIDREQALALELYTDQGAEGCHDWDSFIRFMIAGHVPRHVPEVLYSWRMHNDSTSGNIASKSYITGSHRHTLQRFLDQAGVPDIELVNSPLFSYNVDWWFRRKRVNPRAIQPIAIGADDGIAELAARVAQVEGELIHLHEQDIAPDDDEWRWDAMGLLELFADAVMVGGMLHDGSKVVEGPRVFGFGDGFDCPDSGRLLTDPGYGAQLWKPHTVSAVPAGHCVVRAGFLKQCLAELVEAEVPVAMIGPWLGALAQQAGKRVLYSPFMRARAGAAGVPIAPDARAHFLSRFWTLVPDWRGYPRTLGLAPGKAYAEVDPAENRRHLLRLQDALLPYSRYLESHLRRRAASYPLPQHPASITLITTVYERTDIALLDALAESVIGQTAPAAQWVIVAHGPIAASHLDHITRKSAARWRAMLVVESRPLGIMGAMRRGLENARGEYIVPVDADDLLTPDAIRILTHAIAHFDRPDLVFSDEDLLVNGQPAAPYLRAAFDPVLNLDSSYIWHLCAIMRERALALGLYTDAGATWCHDWDSVMRIANAGGRIEHVPEVLYHWRQHTGSTTNNAEGDPRTLESVRHVLERHIAGTAAPQRFYVADWPENRGARELYIARRPDDLPRFLWVGDVTAATVEDNEDAILVFVANGILIESQQVFVEAARLFDLHPRLGAVGGLVEDRQGTVVDGCCMVDDGGMLDSPWLDKPAQQGGPYALRLKTQSVATTGSALAFFRVAALKQAGAWPLEMHMQAASPAMQLCGLLVAADRGIAFSPLVRARATSAFQQTSACRRPPVVMPAVRQGLARYGLSRNYRE